MPVPTWVGSWTPDMISRLKLLKDLNYDVYFITGWLADEFGGPKESDVVLRKMQQIYFWERMGVDLERPETLTAQAWPLSSMNCDGSWTW